MTIVRGESLLIFNKDRIVISIFQLVILGSQDGL
jgi:hypothetical protein